MAVSALDPQGLVAHRLSPTGERPGNVTDRAFEIDVLFVQREAGIELVVEEIRLAGLVVAARTVGAVLLEELPDVRIAVAVETLLPES
jgi:hypothetical protein